MKPTLMWADHDPKDRQTPIAIYATKTEQRSNRPDLKAVRVLVMPVPNKFSIDSHRWAISALSKPRRK